MQRKERIPLHDHADRNAGGPIRAWSPIARGAESGNVTVISGGGAGTPSDTVSDETAWDIAPDAGASTDYARGDHTHGTPTEPTGGVSEITDLPTAEMDTALVLKPDGAGGVAWGTDATGGGGGYAMWPIDVPPGSPSAYDDEFGGTLAAWTVLGTLDVGNVSDVAGLLHMKRACSSEIDGIYQAVPASYPYTIIAKVSAVDLTAAGHPSVGIILLDSTPTAVRAFEYNQAGGAYYVSLRRYTNRTSFASSADNSFPLWSWIYLRLLVASASSVTFSVSQNGLLWITPANLTAIDPTITPAYFGLSVASPVSAASVEAYIDWIRVT